MEPELINFDNPTEVRTFEKGRFELHRIGPMTLGRASYEPGWGWSEHVGVATGESSCQVETRRAGAERRGGSPHGRRP
jgi:hypothetical protein